MSTTKVVFFYIYIMVAKVEEFKLREQWFNPAEELDNLAHENIVNHLDYTEEVVDNTIALHQETHDHLTQTYESINAIA